MPARSFFVILVALTAVADTAAGQQTHQAACPAMDMIRASADGQGEASVEDLVRQLRKLGLLITADQKKIEAATSEAAYFMFAGRKEHRPRCEPFMLPKKRRWLEDKPVFATKAEKESIDPLFDRLVKKAETDASFRTVFDRVTFYVIPRPAPDGAEAFFKKPFRERSLNERPIDEDNDARIDEDGPEDLNGDGWITAMRVEDAAGDSIPHPGDDRVMIQADPKKGERGRYKLYIEGCDNDGDGKLNEDPPGGVAFNRNFPHNYPYFESGAGPHQVSEVETRAVADFAFDHPNIAVVENEGVLPTESAMGRLARQAQHLQIELQLPKGVALVTGHARRTIGPLAGGGGQAKQAWLVHVEGGTTPQLEVRVWSPMVGSAAKRIILR